MTVFPRVLITDLDNTLYNWVDYFAPSFRSIVHMLSRELKLAEDELYLQFKKVFSERESLEYSFSVQELDACKALDKEAVERLVGYSRAIFQGIRQRRLVPYDGVVDTLRALAAGGVVVVGVTNAPVYHAQMRLKQLGIDAFFDALAGWEGNKVPEDELATTRTIVRRANRGWYRSKIGKTWSVTADKLKPDAYMYRLVLSEFRCRPEECVVVGDSVAKDLSPAMRLGMIGVWARYGRDFSADNFKTLLRITDWSKDQIARSYVDQNLEPNHTIFRFSEVAGILVPPQQSLL